MSAGLVLGLDRLQGHQMGADIEHVLGRHGGVGGIGKGRNVVVAGMRDAALERIDEIEFAPCADAGLRDRG